MPQSLPLGNGAGLWSGQRHSQTLLLLVLLRPGLREASWHGWCLSQVVRRDWSLLTDRIGKSIPAEGTACAKLLRPGARVGGGGAGCRGLQEAPHLHHEGALSGGQWSATLPITHAVPSAMVPPGPAHTLHCVQTKQGRRLALKDFPLHHQGARAGAMPCLDQLQIHREEAGWAGFPVGATPQLGLGARKSLGAKEGQRVRMF